MEKLIFNGGVPTMTQKADFVEYILHFYGKDKYYKAIYPDVGMTVEDAVKCMNVYLEGDYEGHDGKHLWGGGDTVDREKVAEIFIEAASKEVV